MSEIENNISNRLYSFASNLVGNRVFDLYLKYKGITSLTSVSLVPVALILGQSAFKKYLKDAKSGKDNSSTEQQGGKLKIPVIDAPGISSYLKLLGLYHLTFTANTLIPLGVLMAVYEMYQDNIQLGGALVDENMFYNFSKGLVGNRVLDLFLKYKGITTLNSYTLVPVALILGKQAFTDYISNRDLVEKTPSNVSEQLEDLDTTNNDTVIALNQQGGEVKLPFVDDPLIGDYLKIVGLYHLPLTSGTLVPLGVLMAIYQLYQDH